MKRTRGPVLLTCLVISAFDAGSQGTPAQEQLDLEVRYLRVSGRNTLCVGGRNALRVELSARGPVPTVPVPIRLVMLVPGGDAIGVPVAEGSVHFGPGAATTSFTFLNVEVPERMRGRGGVLEVRANLEQAVREKELGNNVRSIRIDSATDWTCRV
jgi:hypothetical protein